MHNEKRTNCGGGHHGRHTGRTETAAAVTQAVLRLRHSAAWPVIRIACGWNLLVHGWGKVTRGPSAFVKAFADHGLRSGAAWVWGALAIEFVGGIALILGLFTRFWAAAAAIEMAIIIVPLLEERLFLAQPRLRIHAAVGLGLLRHRAARRRAVFARSRSSALNGSWQAVPTGRSRSRICSLASRAIEAARARPGVSCVPSSTMRPWSSTRMRSQDSTVASRCAMTSVVRPVISRVSAVCTSVSLSASSEEVASSSSSSGASRRIARAIAMRWRWPPDSVTPRSPTGVS